jgi:hypothetical protein
VQLASRIVPASQQQAADAPLAREPPARHGGDYGVCAPRSPSVEGEDLEEAPRLHGFFAEKHLRRSETRDLLRGYAPQCEIAP